MADIKLVFPQIIAEQKQRIAALEAQVAALTADQARLKATLMPFAMMGRHIRLSINENTPVYEYDGAFLLWADFKRAAALLAELAKGEAK